MSSGVVAHVDKWFHVMMEDIAAATTDRLTAVIARISIFLFHCKGHLVHDGIPGVPTPN